jgi:hypothetical protein
MQCSKQGRLASGRASAAELLGGLLLMGLGICCLGNTHALCASPAARCWAWLEATGAGGGGGCVDGCWVLAFICISILICFRTRCNIVTQVKLRSLCNRAHVPNSA